jgi:hypothetical protein
MVGLMVGWLDDRRRYLGFRKLVNAADKFLMRIQRNIQRWGVKQGCKPVALRVAKSHSPKHVTMQRSFTLATSIIVVNDSCLFLVLLIQQSLLCFLVCAVHLALGGTLLILWRWRRLDSRTSCPLERFRW